MSSEFPLYACHKQVRAVQITQVIKHAHPDPAYDDAEFEASAAFQGAHLLHTATPAAQPIPVTAEWYRKHAPQVGGYYVVYADGYTSYSPARAFEAGYTRVVNDTEVYVSLTGVEFKFNDVVELTATLLSEEERTGRLVQVRKGVGQYGSDVFLIRRADGILLTGENCGLQHKDADIPIMEDDNTERAYTIREQHPEVGFVVMRPKQPQTYSPPFSITVIRD